MGVREDRFSDRQQVREFVLAEGVRVRVLSDTPRVRARSSSSRSYACNLMSRAALYTRARNVTFGRGICDQREHTSQAFSR